MKASMYRAARLDLKDFTQTNPDRSNYMDLTSPSGYAFLWLKFKISNVLWLFFASDCLPFSCMGSSTPRFNLIICFLRPQPHQRSIDVQGDPAQWWLLCRYSRCLPLPWPDLSQVEHSHHAEGGGRCLRVSLWDQVQFILQGQRWDINEISMYGLGVCWIPFGAHIEQTFGEDHDNFKSIFSMIL